MRSGEAIPACLALSACFALVTFSSLGFFSFSDAPPLRFCLLRSSLSGLRTDRKHRSMVRRPQLFRSEPSAAERQLRAEKSRQFANAGAISSDMYFDREPGDRGYVGASGGGGASAFAGSGDGAEFVRGLGQRAGEELNKLGNAVDDLLSSYGFNR